MNLDHISNQKPLKIGIIGAMQVEMEALMAMVEHPVSSTVSGISFVSGTLFSHAVTLAVCGIGKVFAAICTEAMILHFSPDLIINVGVAGTLTSALSIADVAIASDLVQHDMDTSPLGDPPGLLSGINIVNIPCHTALVQHMQHAASALALNAVTGTVASGDQFINSPVQKQKIVDTFSAIACEMEGASVGHVCFVNHIPALVLRTISDSADDSSHMDYGAFVQIAAAQSVRLICHFLSTLPPDILALSPELPA